MINKRVDESFEQAEEFTNSDEGQLSGNARVVLAEVMGLYGREMTGLEATLWKAMIRDFGDEAVIRFLIRHSETSVFAPKPSEANMALCPGRDNAAYAFEEVLRKVASCGPYISPKFEDATISNAIHLMGGWVKVNEQLPDPSNRFDFESFSKRFLILYQQSCANRLRGLDDSGPLLGLHSLTKNEYQESLRLNHGVSRPIPINYSREKSR